MGVAHYNEHDEDIDVAIVLKRQASWAHQTDDGDSSNAKKVAVEFDGPNHFTRKKVYRDGRPSKAVRALGHTVLKYRLLKKTGWTVIRIPYYEFDKIPFWASMVSSKSSCLVCAFLAKQCDKDHSRCLPPNVLTLICRSDKGIFSGYSRPTQTLSSARSMSANTSPNLQTGRQGSTEANVLAC